MTDEDREEIARKVTSRICDDGLWVNLSKLMNEYWIPAMVQDVKRKNTLYDHLRHLKAHAKAHARLQGIKEEK